MSFANYNNKIYKFNHYKDTGTYEIVTVVAEKADVSFEKYRYCFFKEILLENPVLTDIFDIDLWLRYDTGIEGLPLVWDVSLDGFTVIKDGKISIDYHGQPANTENWSRIDKGIWQTFIDLADVSGAYILYQYKKKDGMIFEQPMTVREDVSIEKLLELRRFYGGTL